MRTLKRKCLLTVLVLSIAAGFLSPATVWGGVWVGLQGGLKYASSSNIDYRSDIDLEKTYEGVKFDSHFLGGMMLGYDFVREGALGRAWPSWMKYFSIALDATYETFIFQRQLRRVAWKGNYAILPRYESEITPDGSISMILLTPMIIGRYGFLTSEEIPSGRVQPYLGVGAGVILSNPRVDGFETREKNKLDMSVLFEGGMRFMVVRNVSLDAAFRYRIVPTQFGNCYNLPGGNTNINIDIDNPVFYDALLRLSYHF